MAAAATESRLELARGLVGELLEELALVLEVEIEGPRGVARLGGDLVTRDAGRAVLGEEGPTGFEQSAARARGPRQAGRRVTGVCGRTDGHVIYDSNVSSSGRVKARPG